MSDEAENNLSGRVGALVDMLNSVKTTPTTSLTSYLHSAVVYGTESTKWRLFGEDRAANVYDELVVRSIDGKLRDFSLLMVAYCASHTSGTIFGSCFTKINGNAQLDAWFAANGQSVGNALAVQHLVKKTIWDDPDAPEPAAGEKKPTITCEQLLNREGFTNQLKVRLRDNRLLHALVGELPAGSVCLPAKLLMLLLETWYASDDEMQAIRRDLLDGKQGSDYQSFVVGYDAYDWLAGIETAFSTEGAEYNGLQGSIRGAMTGVVESYCSDSNGGYEPYSNEFGSIIRYPGGTTTVTTGEGMAKWLQEHSSSYFTNTNPPYSTSSHSSGCVKAGTLIMVAPNSLVPIEDIAEGTPVCSIGGTVSFTSGELVRNDAVVDFYAVNDDEPFMSFEHPILTQDGFKCLDPETAKIISPDAPVSLLRVGDVLNRAHRQEDGTIRYTTEVVRRINTAHIEGVVSYDLHFKEGYNSYHANGYPCLLNYPSLTAAGVEERLSYVFNRDERRRVLKRLAGDADLRQAVGETTVSYIQQLVSEPVVKLKAAKNAFLEEEDLRLRFRRIVFDEADGEFSAPGFERLSLYRERLFSDSDTPPLPIERRGRRVFFEVPVVQESAAGGMQESTGAAQSGGLPDGGVLNLVHNGLMAKGVVRENGKVHRFSAYNEDEFRLLMNGVCVGKLAVEHVEDALLGASAPTVRLYLLDPDVGTFKLAEGCTCSVGTRQFTSSSGCITHRTCIDINTPVLASQILGRAQVSFPAQVYLLFDALFMEAIEDARLGDTHGITAELIEDDALARFDVLITEEGSARPPRAETLYGIPEPLLDSQTIDDLVDALGLSLEELYSLPVPESLGAVHQSSFASLMNMMFYRADDAVLEIFGRTRPAVGPGKELSVEEGALAAAHDAFLKGSLSVGYTCNSLQYWDDKYLKDIFKTIPQASEKLDYYLNGDDDTKTMGASPDYGAIMSQLNKVHYGKCVPDLAKYAADRSRNWGQALYDYSLRVENKNNRGLLCGVETQADSSVKHVSGMLDVLDATPQIKLGERTVAFGPAYESAIFDHQATCAAGTFCTMPAHLSPDDFMSLARSLAGSMYDAAFKGTNYCGAPLPAELAAQVKAEAAGQSREDYIEGSASTLRAGLMATQLNEERWFRWMNTAGAAKAIMFTGLLSALSLVALIYSTPESLSGKDIAAVVATVAETVCSVVDVASLYRLHKIVKAADMTVEDALRALECVQQGMPPLRRFSVGGGDLVFDDTASAIAKVEGFKITRSFLKFFNVVLSGVFMVLSLIDTITGWADDTPARRAFAIIDTISNVVMFGVAMLDIVGCVCPLVSALGGVCIVVCIICQLFLMFLPKKHKPSTSENFLMDVGKPFINALPAPSAFYLEKKKLVDEYTKKTEVRGVLMLAGA